MQSSNGEIFVMLIAMKQKQKYWVKLLTDIKSKGFRQINVNDLLQSMKNEICHRITCKDYTKILQSQLI